MSVKVNKIPKALVSSVVPGSPADEAGFSAGCTLYTAEGKVLHDILDWRWLSEGEKITITYRDTEDETGTVTLSREEGEDWGFDFADPLFDDIRQCRNNCTFCFMKQLPSTSRASLKLRDDDFRLSFLQGTFVTLTNLSTEDEERIIEQRISPLRVSLHAITNEVRRSLIGKHANHGLEACKRLLDSGIEMHMQIVLVPGANDGVELVNTLTWAYSQTNIMNVGIVSIGYTRYQDAFDRSFNDPSEAKKVIEQVASFQDRALNDRGYAWVFLADEFYRSAYGFDLLEHLPASDHYGSYDLFEDGIGIIRSFVDDWNSSVEQQENLARLLNDNKKRVHMVVGMAQREFLEPLVQQSALNGLLLPLPIVNEYFGGNVDVTGLLCGCDIVAAIGDLDIDEVVALPSVIFNADGMTLDDMSLKDIQTAARAAVIMVSCNASDYLDELEKYFN